MTPWVMCVSTLWGHGSNSRVHFMGYSLFRTFLRVGHGVGQAVDPHFDPHRFGQKSKKNPRNHTISGIFWSCWADSNRRPHPYQVLESLPPLAVQGFSVLFSPKRMRSRPVHSVVSIRSFPRVGHGVGQAKNTGRISWRTPVFSSCRFAQVTRVTSSTK